MPVVTHWRESLDPETGEQVPVPLTRSLVDLQANIGGPSFSRVFLKRTDAVWIISYGVAALDLAVGDLVELPANMSDTLGPVGMTTRADDRLSEAAMEDRKREGYF